MINLKTLANKLEEKLNNTNLQGVVFSIKADTKAFEKALRRGNAITEIVNGLLVQQTSEQTTLTDGQVFATVGCRLQVIFRLKGGFPDENQEIIDPETNQVVETIEGNYARIQRVRDALTTAFQENTQEPLQDSSGRTFLVTTIYSFADTGVRMQSPQLGDSFSFSASIAYFIVQNGINTQNVKYRLDGKLIPFQTNTAYRTPTMDGNVYADSLNGAVKNIASQSIFNISFQLPAIDNEITRAMFKWLFKGSLNTCHILNVTYPIFGAADETDSYLVTFGENNAAGETIKNIGQTLTLVECTDDYEIVDIPDSYYIYERTGANLTRITVSGTAGASVYNFNSKQFGYLKAAEGETPAESTLTQFSIATGDVIISTAALEGTTGWTVIQTDAYRQEEIE